MWLKCLNQNVGPDSTVTYKSSQINRVTQRVTQQFRVSVYVFLEKKQRYESAMKVLRPNLHKGFLSDILKTNYSFNMRGEMNLKQGPSLNKQTKTGMIRVLRGRCTKRILLL